MGKPIFCSLQNTRYLKYRVLSTRYSGTGTSRQHSSNRYNKMYLNTDILVFEGLMFAYGLFRHVAFISVRVEFSTALSIGIQHRSTANCIVQQK